MKKLFSVFAAMVFVFCLTNATFAGGGSGGAGSPVSEVDSLRTAQVFGGLDIRSYEGNANFRRGVIKDKDGDGMDEWVNMSFKMAVDGKITYLKIQDVVVVAQGDEPLPGLPVNKIGETRDFNLNLWTAGTEPSAHGYFYAQLLLPGDPIVVYLQPNYVRREVKFSGNGTGLVLQTKTGGTFEYEAFIQGFYVWVEPTRITEYSVFDPKTGITYQKGVIDPLKDTAPAPTSHLITVKLPIGIEQVPESSYESFNYQKLDGQVNGVSAKVYIWDLKKSGGSIEIYGLTRGNVTVKRWTALGEMPSAITTSTNTSDGSRVTVESGYDKVIIIVTGATTEEGFTIYFNRWNDGGLG